MPSRGRAIGPSMEEGGQAGPYQVHDVPPRQEALNQSREKKMETEQCKKDAVAPPAGHGQGDRAAVRVPSPAGRMWHLNGLEFDWPAGVKHWRATPLDRMDY